MSLYFFPHVCCFWSIFYMPFFGISIQKVYMSVNMLRYFKDILLFFHQRVKKSFLNIYFLLVSLLCTIRCYAGNFYRWHFEFFISHALKFFTTELKYQVVKYQNNKHCCLMLKRYKLRLYYYYCLYLIWRTCTRSYTQLQKKNSQRWSVIHRQTVSIKSNHFLSSACCSREKIPPKAGLHDMRRHFRPRTNQHLGW